MENFEFNSRDLMEKYYKQGYTKLFNRIKQIKTPIKNDILKALLDGKWHSELELIRIGKKKQKFIGSVTIGSMIHSLNNILENDYIEKKVVDGKLYYKLSDNYVGLSRAAYTRYQHKELNLD
jgi:hypothetical protein